MNSKPTATYDDWRRAIFDAAHHDIWWVKEQQMSAGNWTLLLLGALVGVNQLLTSPGQTPAPTQPRLLGLASLLVVGLGSYYVWDLYLTMVRSRRRAKAIVEHVDDPNGIFTESKRDPKRHGGFPVAITAVFAAAWAITLWLFSFRGQWVWLPPAALWLIANVWGLWRRSKL
jgi:hypothetical protein